MFKTRKDYINSRNASKDKSSSRAAASGGDEKNDEAQTEAKLSNNHREKIERRR
jgi:hypothetical protein